MDAAEEQSRTRKKRRTRREIPEEGTMPDPRNQKLLSGGDKARRFVQLSLSDFLTDPPPMRWLVPAVWPAGGYGAFGGPKKTLKSYTALALAISVASGRPLFGHAEFTPQDRRHVVVLVSEGGKNLLRRRVRLIAQAMGIDGKTAFTELHKYLHLVPDAAPVGSEELTDAIAKYKRRYAARGGVGLFVLDAFYGFHPAGTDNSDLYSRGTMLQSFKAEVVTDDCGLILVDHFSKSRADSHDLDGFTQSGMAEFSHSWALLEHDQPPRVSEGLFVVKTTFAGRDGYQTSVVVRWNIGQVDPAQRIPLGPISAEIVTASAPGGGATAGELFANTPKEARIQAYMLRLLDQHPWRYTKDSIITKVAKAAQVHATEVRSQYQVAIDEGWVQTDKLPPKDGDTGRVADRAARTARENKWHLKLVQAEADGTHMSVDELFHDADSEENGAEISPAGEVLSNLGQTAKENGSVSNLAQTANGRFT